MSFDSKPLPESLLVALGGNAIVQPGRPDDIPNQFACTKESMREIVGLLRKGVGKLVVTHGNGPQVGNRMLRSELTKEETYPLPLDVCGADTQGSMGYMIQQSLNNLLLENGNHKTAVSVVTQVLVSPEDHAFKEPTKYVGCWYEETEAMRLQEEKGWAMKEDSGRGWRRVVPSPLPLEVVELPAIKTLVDAGHVVVAVGGGGIPVVKDAQRGLVGVEGVIDKDLASARLAADLGVKTLLILTGVDKVAINFNKPNMEEVDRASAEQMKGWMEENQFPAGSMGPKIRAALWFLEQGGERVIITSVEKSLEALEGRSGTEIVVKLTEDARPIGQEGLNFVKNLG